MDISRYRPSGVFSSLCGPSSFLAISPFAPTQPRHPPTRLLSPPSPMQRQPVYRMPLLPSHHGARGCCGRRAFCQPLNAQAQSWPQCRDRSMVRSLLRINSNVSRIDEQLQESQTLNSTIKDCSRSPDVHLITSFCVSFSLG